MHCDGGRDGLPEEDREGNCGGLVVRRGVTGAWRRLALNLLKREKTKRRGVKGKQLNAGWDHAYLLRLLGS